MIEKAKEMIREEMNKEKGIGAEIIGDYLLKQIEVNQEAAEKIIAGDKTIKEAHAEIAKVAKGRAVNGSAGFIGEEGYKEVTTIIANYYGFNSIQESIKIVQAHEVIRKVEEVPEEKPKKRRFHVDMNDL